MSDTEMEEAPAASAVTLDEVMALVGDQEALKVKIQQILDENASLRSKVAELEEERQREVDGHIFQIDTDPVEDEAADTQDLLYEVKGQALKQESQQEVEVEEEKPGPKSVCWNCDGDHNLSECPEPRDHQKIAKNRKEFMKNQPANTARYHIDETQRFGKLTPGLPSDKLRDALGLKGDQLPPYIYRLREMGYPPGWLKQAEIQTSGVALYVSAGKSIKAHGEEDGEVVEEGDKTEYDIHKLVSWPGFNVPLDSEDDFRDETNYYRVPPMQPAQSLDEMLQELTPKRQKGYVRGQMQDTSEEGEVKSTEDSAEGEAKEEEAEVKEVKPALLSDEVKAVDEGTPIVNVYSSFDNLPEQKKWATGTVDHMLFENLPDSTGKWDQMLGVIKKTRKLRENLAATAEKK